METVLSVGLGNAVAAGLLALGAATIGVFPFARNRPALRHGLWLLVLLKLVTPPLWSVPVARFTGPGEERAARTLDRPEVEPEPMPIDPPEAEPEIVNDAPVSVVEEPPASEPEPTIEPWGWEGWVLAAWGVGSLLTFGVASGRIRRFRRLLSLAEPAPGPLRARVETLAGRLGLKSAPEVRQVPGAVSPLIWALGCRPRLIVPTGLWDRLDDRQRDTLLTHELAHLKRRDHWVRCLELLVTGLYWWLPLVWIARRGVREAEEQCCDAWVVWAFPDAARTYAEALLETLDFLSGAGPDVAVAACGLGPVHHLKRRMTMILQGTTPRALTWSGLLAVLGLSATFLPISPTWAQRPSIDVEFNDPREAMLFKVLKDEGEFNDPRWPFLIKVKDVQDKTLIDATFKHRARGLEGSNTFDMIVNARKATIDFDNRKGVARVHLDGADFVNPSKDVSLIGNTILEIPIPTDSDLVNEEDEETPAFAPESPVARDPGPRPKREGDRERDRPEARDPGPRREREGDRERESPEAKSRKPEVRIFKQRKQENVETPTKRESAEAGGDDLRRYYERLYDVGKPDREGPEAEKGDREGDKRRVEYKVYKVEKDPKRDSPEALKGDREGDERGAEIKRLMAEVAMRRKALREAEMQLDRVMRQFGEKREGGDINKRDGRFELRIVKPGQDHVIMEKKLGSNPFVFETLPRPDQEKRFAELEERLERLQDEVKSLRKDAPERR